MRIVQIIDSLEIGGAERMALNFANALVGKIDFSGIVATRAEGLLVDQIDKKASYLFLNRKKKIDFRAVFRLRKFITVNKVNIVHAHSSSFFIAVLLKFTLPKIKIVWHDHYGISQDLKARKNLSLKFGSFFFSGIISVNTALKKWSEEYLWCTNIIYLPNFIDESTSSKDKIELKGVEGKRIVCVANLRPQKNHHLLIKTAAVLQKDYPDWTFHLFGKDFNNQYSADLKTKINDLNLNKNVTLYGAVNNIGSVLQQCDIAVLPSLSEGLPLAVLEYGLYSLPVVATNVGQVSKVITSENKGLLIESDNLEAMINSITYLINNKAERKLKGLNLNKLVSKQYGKDSIINEYKIWIHAVTKL